MALRRFEMTVVTDGAGAATVYSPRFSGYIEAIDYIKTDYTNGVVFLLTAEATGETIWSQTAVNATATVAPRQPTHTTAGVASLYAAGGTGVNSRIALGGDRVKIVLASGGATKTGRFVILASDG